MGTSLLLLNLGDLLAFGSTSPTPNTARMAFIIYCSQRSLAEIQQVGVFLLLRPSDIWNCRGWLNSRKLQVSCDTCSAKVLKKKKAYCSVLMKDVSKPTCGRQGHNVTSEECPSHSLVVCSSGLLCPTPTCFLEPCLCVLGSRKAPPLISHSNRLIPSSKFYLWMRVFN